MDPPLPSAGRSNSTDLASNKQAKQRELEDFAQSYVKYTKLAEDITATIHHDPQALEAAYARITEETRLEQAGNPPASSRSPEQIQADLRKLARRCDITPTSFDDRVRISFAAVSYVCILVDNVLVPDRPHSDFLTVLGMANRLLRKVHTGKPCPTPTVAPAIVKLTPANPVTRSGQETDITLWQSHPEELIGHRFISNEMIRRVFVVTDFAVKRVKGPQFDVVYEDTDEVLTVDPDSLFDMVAGAELITNVINEHARFVGPRSMVDRAGQKYMELIFFPERDRSVPIVSDQY
ncbi:unnamed protein product [Cyclocybe aegerita]|uniref:Uncharacterized protein n=1 Tax=Cyclocybe aegerita TaxID=1973307 RepID=A0A8S0WRB3_CYCAE|nr:unnamed protein product [Cyclocybe aegerita]